jgi:hypothetical protein
MNLMLHQSVLCCTLLFAVSLGLIGCRPPFLQKISALKDPLAAKGWTDPNKLTPNTIQHSALPAEQRKRIQVLQKTFREVDPSPVEKWTEDFRRDNDPEHPLIGEIRIYEGMADAYTTYCTKRHLTTEAKQDVYQIVILRSGTSDKEVLSHINLKVLSVEEAKKVLSGYKMAPAPILIMKQ